MNLSNGRLLQNFVNTRLHGLGNTQPRVVIKISFKFTFHESFWVD